MKRLLLILCLAAVLLTACGGKDVSPTDNPEEGTYNLTAASLTVPTSDVPDYVFYTNSTQIAVAMPDGASGTVTLYDAASDALVGTADFSENAGHSVTFSNLTAACRYRIVCEGFTDCEITISDGN